MPKSIQTRTQKIDKYLPFIESTLQKYPKLNDTQINQMVKESGYEGGVDHFCDLVRTLRPLPKTKVFLRLSTLPGEQAQCDWGFFGKLKCGNA